MLGRLDVDKVGKLAQDAGTSVGSRREIRTMDRNEAKVVAQQAVVAVQCSPVSGTITLKKFVYGPHGVDVVIRISPKGSEHGIEAEKLRVNAGLFGLKPTIVGKTILYAGSQFTVVGLRGNGRAKLPILAKRADGEMRVLALAGVARGAEKIGETSEVAESDHAWIFKGDGTERCFRCDRSRAEIRFDAAKGAASIPCKTFHSPGLCTWCDGQRKGTVVS